MIRKYTFLLGLFLLIHTAWAQPNGLVSLSGLVKGKEGEALSAVTVFLEGSSHQTLTDEEGFFYLKQIKPGSYVISLSYVGYKTMRQNINLNAGQPYELVFVMQPMLTELKEVEVFGERDKQPEKLQYITRLPLKPSEQIQSISVISERLVEAQGNLTITEATRNVPGVYNFATYGNRRESMSSRGFRGIPVLKNGVRVHSDFRGLGFVTDMEGVESIQVMKGASAITQGIAGDLGSPGGIINIATKTPRFYQGGQASLRVGTFGQVRPTFDVFGPLNASKTIAFRINGALERSDSYRKHVQSEKFYINPSLEWRPDDKTSLTLEMDYLSDSRTPDLGTVALSNEYHSVYKLPFDQFLGFKTDLTNSKNATYTARLNRKLNDQFTVRAAYFRSSLELSDVSATLTMINNQPASMRRRALAQSGRTDKNSVLQLDLIGQEIQTGFLKHTFQVGMDFRTMAVETPVYASTVIDTIDVLQPINNTLPFVPASRINSVTKSNEQSIGFMAQDAISITSWAKALLGIRYNIIQSANTASAAIVRGNGYNPLAGIILTPYKGLNVFASYTNSTNPRTATLQDKDGNELGSERIDQLEAGIKSEWLNNRLRFNITLYKINNRNMNLQVFERDANGILIAMPYYMKGGNDERKGIETELTGRVLENLELIAGYALISAQYKEHTTFVENSSPLNTPRHTANLWLNYAVKSGGLKGISLGVGAYYVGARPSNDWTKTAYHEITPGQAPWYYESYTTVNLSASYSVKNIGIRLLANNILDAEGYNAYRVSYINPIDPRNFAAVVSYRF